MYPRGKKLCKPITQNKIKIPFILKKKKKETKDRIIRDICGHFLKQKKKKRKKEITEKKRNQ